MVSRYELEHCGKIPIVGLTLRLPLKKFMHFLHSGLKLQLPSAEYVNTSYTPNEHLRNGKKKEELEGRSLPSVMIWKVVDIVLSDRGLSCENQCYQME